MLVGKRSLFVDTSGWIEVFGKDNPQHQRARDIVQKAVVELRPIVTTNYVITEFVGRGGKACRLNRVGLFETVEVILHLPTIEIVHIGEQAHSIALTLLHQRLDKNWSLVDITSFQIMQERGITEALSTDHHFEQAGFIKLL